MHKIIVHNNTRFCKKCESWKDLSEFNLEKKSSCGVRSQCRECEKFYKISIRYNVSIDEAKRLWEVPSCDICKKLFSDYGTGHNRHRCIDHCHKSGIVRGVLCNACNGALGYFEDDITIMKGAIHYLEKELESKGIKLI